MERSVLVLDSHGIFVEYVDPAVARRALKAQVVSTQQKDPLIIRLGEGLKRCPRLFGRVGERYMKSLAIFDEMFKEEKPLWVKCMTSGQVSFEIPTGPGMMQSVKVPKGDPVCITDLADFQSLKRCTDLRTLASPRQGPQGLRRPALMILTEPEVRKHYAEKATRRGWFTPDGEPDIERAATPVFTAPDNPMPVSRVDLPPSATAELAASHSDVVNLQGDGQLTIAEAVHPRVLQLCMEAGNKDIQENLRPSADMLLDEFEAIHDELSEESLAHIQSFGTYKSVKTWALRMMQARHTTD